jgi:hypothetical protein
VFIQNLSIEILLIVFLAKIKLSEEEQYLLLLFHNIIVLLIVVLLIISRMKVAPSS